MVVHWTGLTIEQCSSAHRPVCTLLSFFLSTPPHSTQGRPAIMQEGHNKSFDQTDCAVQRCLAYLAHLTHLPHLPCLLHQVGWGRRQIKSSTKSSIECVQGGSTKPSGRTARFRATQQCLHSSNPSHISYVPSGRQMSCTEAWTSSAAPAKPTFPCTPTAPSTPSTPGKQAISCQKPWQIFWWDCLPPFPCPPSSPFAPSHMPHQENAPQPWQTLWPGCQNNAENILLPPQEG